MSRTPGNKGLGPPQGVDLKDEDIFAAMEQIPGYLDITPGDFKAVYQLAYQQALERLSREVTAGEIMTRDVISVRPDTPLAEVAAAMGQQGVSGVPVVDEAGRVVGVISEKDFLTHMGVKEPKNFMVLVAGCLKSKGCIALPIKKQQAGDIMSSPALTVGEATPVKEIAAIFTRKGINRVAVTGTDGRLRGIVSRGDIVRAATRRGRP